MGYLRLLRPARTETGGYRFEPFDPETGMGGRTEIKGLTIYGTGYIGAQAAIDEAKRVLGFRPSVGLEEGLARLERELAAHFSGGAADLKARLFLTAGSREADVLDRLSHLVARLGLVREIDAMLTREDTCGKGRPGRSVQHLGGAFEIDPSPRRKQRREMRQTPLPAPVANQLAVRHVKGKH